MTTEQFLTPQEFAAKMSYHVRTIHKWIKEGRLVAYNTNPDGGRPTWRIPESEMQKFMILPKVVRKKKKNKNVIKRKKK